MQRKVRKLIETMSLTSKKKFAIAQRNGFAHSSVSRSLFAGLLVKYKVTEITDITRNTKMERGIKREVKGTFCSQTREICS